jgi:hypothetical protein
MLFIFFLASYYVAAPLSLASSCLPEAIQYLRYQIAEFIVKGRARMPDLSIDPSHLLKPLLKLGWCQWIGAVIFIWGSLHQIRCHAILVCIHISHSTSYLFVANANNMQQQLVHIKYSHAWNCKQPLSSVSIKMMVVWYAFFCKLLGDTFTELFYVFGFHCFCIMLWQGSLREHKDSDEYVIPCGDWFSLVSCPHYLAELVSSYSLPVITNIQDVAHTDEYGRSH